MGKRKKVLDLLQKDVQERKYLKEGSREYANTVLGERKAYVFGEMKEDPEGGEEEFASIKINGAACRTPDEDIKWEEEESRVKLRHQKVAKLHQRKERNEYNM